MTDQVNTPATDALQPVTDPTDPGQAPEPIDDGDIKAAVKSYEKEDKEALKELDPDGIKPKIIQDDARGRIARQFQEDRKARAAAEAGQPDDDASLREKLKLTNVMTGGQIRNPFEGEEGDGGTVLAPRGKEPAQDTIRVKVYGKEYDVPRSDDRWFSEGATDEQIKRNAQISLAAEAKLAIANSRTQVPNQIQDGVAQPATTANQPQAQAGERPQAPQTRVPKEKISEIVDLIQNGTTEDGEQAVSDLLALAAESAGRQGKDIQSEVRSALVQEKQSDEIDRAARGFAAENGDLLEKPLLGKYVLDTVQVAMLDEMRGLGVDEALLAPIKGNGLIVARVYNQLKADGASLKTHRELLDHAGNKLRADFNIPHSTRVPGINASPGALNQRAEAKRTMQTQPRSAGARSNATPQGPRPQTRAEYIAAEKVRRMGGRTAT